MHRFTESFIRYCENVFCFENEQIENYQSLPICIIECVYSLRARYDEVTIPIVERYASYYLNGNKYSSSDTISKFLNNLEKDGLRFFADNVVRNNQYSGRTPKVDVCYKLAQYLKCLHIETIDDFQKFQSQELLNIVVQSVKGIGYAGANYLFMLAGDESRCKPDVHIHRCIVNACGSDVSDEECQTIFTEAVDILSKQYPYLTVRKLDRIIWQAYRKKYSEK